jgi:hypothetical protein
MLLYPKRHLKFQNIPKKELEISADREIFFLRPKQSKNYQLSKRSISLISLISAVTIHSSNDVSYKVNDIQLIYKYRLE